MKKLLLITALATSAAVNNSTAGPRFNDSWATPLFLQP
jgi:hypothetical protein